MDHSEEFKRWLATRPAIIQEMAAAYPPGRYRMTPDAPYAISCPGTLVTLIGYTEVGKVIVVVDAEDLRPEAIEHQKKLLNRRGGDYSEVDGKPSQVYVDPNYIELVEEGL